MINEYKTVSYSLTEDVVKLIKQLSDYHGVCKSGIVRLAIKTLARELKLI